MSIFAPNPKDIVELDGPPLLTVIVDTEEEFDWSRPVARENTATTAMRAQGRAHRIFEDYGIAPTYVIDYPVATRPDGFAPLKELHDGGLCEIGAHLHPWVNPPFEEEVSNHNSYPGNLPAALEREKLRILAAEIEERFGARPRVYKAGRYGAGPATEETLKALGFEIDASVVPQSDFISEDGPDFSACVAKPYWIDRHGGLLEIPMSAGFVGALSGLGPGLHARTASETGRAMRVPGVLARLGLFERIVLTPEGITHDEHRRLTEGLLARGVRSFCFAYHSPSLEPGHTPYVRDGAELETFLDRFRRYFDYFIHEVGGQPITHTALRDRLTAARAAA